MSPTLNLQERFWDRWFHDFVLVLKNADFRTGDIVVLREPSSNERSVKRLVVRENEDVEFEGGFHAVPRGH